MNSGKRESRSAGRPADGRYAYAGLDRVLHEKARLGIITSLLTSHDGLSFADLKNLCALSDGNLNRHLLVLQEAGVVQVEKQGAGRSSRTLCRLSAQGRAAFAEYLSELERVIADAAAASAQQRVKTPAHSVRPGWSV